MARVVGDDDEVGPGPRPGRGAGGAQQRRRRLAEDGQDVAGAERHQPGAFVVVADGHDDRRVRERRLDGLVERLRGPPARRPPPVDGDEAARARRRARPVKENVTPDGETQTVRTRGAVGRGAPATGAEQAVGGLEGLRARARRRSAAAACRRRRRVGRRTTPAAGRGRRRTGRGGGAAATAGPGRRRPGSRPRARPARAGGRGARGGRGRPARDLVVVVRLGGQAEPPAGPSVVGVDEALAAAHVAAQVEGGDLHPVGAVAEAVLGDLPQALAGTDGVDGVGTAPALVAAAGAAATATTARRRGAPRRRRQHQGGAGARRASTPTAMRAATRSSGDIMPSGRISPRRTCTTTPRTSCDAQAAQATQAASASAHSASRGAGCHECPRPPDSGLPTTSTRTAGTAVKASSAATTAPTTSASAGRRRALPPTHRPGRS